MILYNKTKNIIVSRNIRIADNFFSRLFGLIPCKSISNDEGLLITKCSSIHTCFMRFDIDAIFVKGDKVIDIITLKSWRFSRFYDSDFVIEFNSNFAYDKISVGDIIELRKF